ncbi:YceH family protein [Marinomonas fungiae]|uniref:YceH family protein n=1 Tax=Marinomonas fungiae TaxID=1137284 RepID=UPI003A913B9C
MSYYTLTAMEARVIGSLIEKSIVTPDHYPMSINALTNACNQKSSRDPVVSYTEFDVQDTIDALVARSLVTEEFYSGSRVAKYQHRFCNTEFSDLQFNEGETAVLCMLLLRGPQTPGELRSRSGRLYAFTSIQEVEQALASLKEKTGGPFVEQLPREPGKREARFQELFCSESNIDVNAEELVQESSQEDLLTRIDSLEQTVADLSARLAALEANTGL